MRSVRSTPTRPRPRPADDRGMSTGSKIFLLVLVVLGAAGVLAYRAWVAGTAPLGELSDTPVEITIPQGSGAAEVARLLEQSGVIRSATAFRAAATLDGRATMIQAGTYQLSPGLDAGEILDQLVAGPPGPAVFRVTIPEGLGVDATLARIADADGSPFTQEQLRAALVGVPLPAWVPSPAVADGQGSLPPGAEPFEGLLFPDTYEFTVEQGPDEVLARLVAQTDAVMQEVGAASRNDLDLYQTLILASLIEREARLADERPQISSVIHNRLGIGQALQIDATVVYGIGVETGETPTRLTTDDYSFASPWSTYTNPGLPPTPISGAGRSSIEAAANPADTEFFFYVVEDPATGRHRFSQTFEEHQQAIREIRGG